MSEAGTYYLQTINGNPPPGTVKVLGPRTTAVTDAQIVLTPPHGFAGYFKYVTTEGADTTEGEERWNEASGGRYTRTDDTHFRFVNPNNSTDQAGTIEAGLLTLHAGRTTFVYQK